MGSSGCMALQQSKFVWLVAEIRQHNFNTLNIKTTCKNSQGWPEFLNMRPRNTNDGFRRLKGRLLRKPGEPKRRDRPKWDGMVVLGCHGSIKEGEGKCGGKVRVLRRIEGSVKELAIASTGGTNRQNAHLLKSRHSAMQIGVRYENEDKNEWMEGESSGMKHGLGSCDSNDKWNSCRLRRGPGAEGGEVVQEHWMGLRDKEDTKVAGSGDIRDVNGRPKSGAPGADWQGRARAVTAGGGAVVEGGAQVGPRWRIYKWGEVARDSVGRPVEAGGGRNPDVKLFDEFKLERKQATYRRTNPSSQHCKDSGYMNTPPGEIARIYRQHSTVRSAHLFPV
ncbi:hypothetical protein B0H14DRAFT_3662581 [Mycena olivaceomarginata]|nr:hypothetical protein B0H14DRAFT_3662581 [Mycena olivaceomarginata]